MTHEYELVKHKRLRCLVSGVMNRHLVYVFVKCQLFCGILSKRDTLLPIEM